MRRHPDELSGPYRSDDAAAIRQHFEDHPGVFEAALDEYRTWKRIPSYDVEMRETCRVDMLRRARAAGADPHDWYCVLMYAARRRELGLPCPPWWGEEDQP